VIKFWSLTFWTTQIQAPFSKRAGGYSLKLLISCILNIQFFFQRIGLNIDKLETQVRNHAGRLETIRKLNVIIESLNLIGVISKLMYTNRV